MNIKFSPEELNFIQQVLGELPAKTGAFMVLQSINAQVAEQQPKADAPATTE